MQKIKISGGMLVYVFSLFLTGCSIFTSPLDQPVIEEKLNPQWLKPGTVGTLSLVHQLILDDWLLKSNQ